MLEILLSSSVLIAVLALLRRFLRGRISARLRYALWALVLLRLLVPVTTFESKVSVAAAAEPIRVQVQQYSAQREQTVYIPVDMGAHPETGEPMEAVGRAYVEPLDVARWLWYAGMGAVALWFLLVNLLMARRLKKDRVYYGTHRSVPVYIAKNIPSPCLFGLLRPAIYLTEPAAADETQAARILAHEYSHLCHGDLFWALLRSLCLVIYWFDPFVWWAAALSRRDAELACDESAIAALGEEQRYEYGRTLLALATVKLRPGDLLCGATTMTGGKNSLRERIEGIARTKKLSLSLAAAALVIVALTVGCTFSGAQSDATGPAPTVTPAPVPVPTDSGLIPLNELPAGYHYGEIGPSEVSIWDTKQNVAVGGIVAHPTPDLPLHTGVADEDGNIEENNLNEWLKALGVPEALDYRFGSMGAGAAVGDLEMIYWTEEAFQAELGDISRRHEFFIAGDVVYDVWFDELLIDHDDILSILAAMSFPEVNSILLGEGYESYDVMLFDDSGSDAQSSVSIGGELAEVLKTVEGASEAYMLYSQYLDDFMDPDPTRWLTWLRIENDVEKQLNLDNYHPLLSAEILSVEKINDKLFAFVARVQDSTGLPAQSIFNFLVLEPDEGSYVIRNVDGIPEELSENLDPSRYDPQLLMDDGMTALGAPDQTLLGIYEELMAFAEPEEILVSKSDFYVSDGTAQWDMTLEELVHCTDSWNKTERPGDPLSESEATIVLRAANGDSLYVLSDTPALYLQRNGEWFASYNIIGEQSGSWYFDTLIRWADPGSAGTDTTPGWQLHYQAAEDYLAQRDEFCDIMSVGLISDQLWHLAVGTTEGSFWLFMCIQGEDYSFYESFDDVPEELRGNLDRARYAQPPAMEAADIKAIRQAAEAATIGMAPNPDQMAIQATLLDFTNPAFVMVSRDERYVSDGTAFADMNFEDLLFSTDSWQVDTTPRSDTSRSGTYIALFDGNASFVIIDAERDEISFHPQSQFYAAYSIPGVSGSYYYDSLLAWAETFPDAGDADRASRHEDFLTLAFTTDWHNRYTLLQTTGPDASAYNEFYEPFERLCDTDFYYTMMLNREVYKLDKLAMERGYRLTPLSISLDGPTPLSETDNLFAFTVELRVSLDSGSDVSGSISGTIETTGGEAYVVTGFQINEGTVLNADPADDVLLGE